MSIGPRIKEEMGISRMGRIRVATTEIINKYFEKPLHYLFYFFLTATMVGLFFGKEFTILYYVFFAGLGGANFYLGRDKTIVTGQPINPEENGESE